LTRWAEGNIVGGVIETLRQEWGQRLRTHRERSGLTQKELGKAARVSQTTIASLEAGWGTCSDKTKVRLAEVLGVEVGDVFPWPDSAA
jgi:DNA-binding XRE family transcriptional regulator